MIATFVAALSMALAAGPPSSDDCLALYHGIGRPRDLLAARQCLESAVDSPCQGSSPGLARAELAVMYLDGQGGPPDPERAWGLLRGCFEDATVQGLRKRFENSSPTGTFDFCSELGGTTLTINECAALRAASADEVRSSAVARLRKSLPANLHDRLDAAEQAWSAFQRGATDLAEDEFRGGTIATSFALEANQRLSRERTLWLDGLPRLRPADCDARALAEEDARLNVAYRREVNGDTERSTLLRAAQRAWIVSRDADAALVRAWKGTAQATTVLCLATRARAAALEAVRAERDRR